MKRAVRSSTADYLARAKMRLDVARSGRELAALDLQAAEAAIREGRLDEAFYACSAANLVAPSERSRLLMAWIRHRRGEYADAADELSHAIELTISPAARKNLLRLRAFCRLRTDDARGAIADLRESGVDVFRDRVSRDLLHGDVLAAAGCWKKARRLYVNARGSAHADRAIGRLAEIWAACPIDSLRDGKRALQFAEALHRRRAIGEARAYDLLAAAHAELGNFAAAQAWALKAFRASHPRNQASRRRRFRLYRAGEPLRIRSIDDRIW